MNYIVTDYIFPEFPIKTQEEALINLTVLERKKINTYLTQNEEMLSPLVDIIIKNKLKLK